jgi:hypothetical protein
MARHKLLAFIVASFILFVAAGCRSQTVAPQESEEPPYPVGEEEAPQALLSAMDSALAYMRQNFGSEAPSEDMKWIGERITEEGLVGGESYRFVSGDWEIIASYPVVRLDLTIYSFGVENKSSGFLWEGEVDAEGDVGEKAPDLVKNAFYAALEYLLINHADRAPEVGLPWISRYTTPKDIVGSGTYEFITGEWLVTVNYPIVAPQSTIYSITFLNQGTGFQWEGEVDADGKVTEKSISQ